MKVKKAVTVYFYRVHVIYACLYMVYIHVHVHGVIRTKSDPLSRLGFPSYTLHVKNFLLYAFYKYTNLVISS